MAACHENSAGLTNVCAFGRRQKSFHSLSTSHLERFSVWWVCASWQPELVMCPPLLKAPGWVLRTVDLLGHFLRLQLAPRPLCHGLLPGTAHPAPAPCSNRVNLNCQHCQRPVMLWLCCPWQGPAWSVGNLPTITLHNRFYYHLFAHSHSAVFSNNRSQGRMTPVISQCGSHRALLHSHRPHVTVQSKLALLILIKILTISKHTASLICPF